MEVSGWLGSKRLMRVGETHPASCSELTKASAPARAACVTLCVVGQVINCLSDGKLP